MDDHSDSENCDKNDLDNDGFDFPEDYDTSEMLDEVSLDEGFSSVTDRYFTSYYKINAQKPFNDICIRIHSNRICLLTLAPSHPVIQDLQDGKKIEINFKVTEKLDRTVNKLSGKGKHGAQPLQEYSNICIIKSSSGEVWPIKCCMSGKLIEVNEAVQENPYLLLKPPHLGGYIAIALPNIKYSKDMKAKLLDETSYKAAVEKRQNWDLENLGSIKRMKKNDGSIDAGSNESILQT